MPANKSIDQDFLQYQKTGNPEHLAKVFDGTAARLLQLAEHMTPDANAADDLVQATFLTAIQRREAYKPTGHVLSWLFGILANEARVRRRAAGHNMDSLGSSEELVDAKQESPQAALERQELSREVKEAIAKLPKSYRPVLNLHLRYCLSPSEIAANLERPAGSVRKQIHRGLEMLRQSLPESLIAGAVVLTVPATGLAAMRETVLCKATVVAAKAASTSAALAKLTLWTAAGTLTAAALAVSLYAPDIGQVTFDELSSRATAQVVAQKESVDSLAIATSALQADPFSPSSRVLMTISAPVSNAPGGADTMNNIMKSPSSPLNLGVPALLLGAMGLLTAVGQSQSVIYTHQGDAASQARGQSTSAVGDLNGDGYADIVTGAAGYSADLPDGTVGNLILFTGRVYAHSGYNGTLLFTVDGENLADTLGGAVTGAGDVNGDGTPDIAASAPGYDVDFPDGTVGNLVTSVGRVYMFSGKGGATIHTFDGEAKSDFLSDIMSDVGDVDFDGYDDIIVV